MVSKSNDYWRTIHTHDIFINFPQTFDCSAFLSVQHIIQIDLTSCFSALNPCLSSQHHTMKRDVLLQQTASAMHLPSLLAGTPLLIKRTTAEPGKERGRLRRYHINVTPRHWCDFSILWAPTSPGTSDLKDKRDIRRNSLNVKWERSDRGKNCP